MPAQVVRPPPLRYRSALQSVGTLEPLLDLRKLLRPDPYVVGDGGLRYNNILPPGRRNVRCGIRAQLGNHRGVGRVSQQTWAKLVSTVRLEPFIDLLEM